MIWSCVRDTSRNDGIPLCCPEEASKKRARAHEARQDVREAKKYRMRQEDGQQLPPWQKDKVEKLHIGELESRMIAANVSYGHGEGAERKRTREESISYDIAFERQFTNYFTK